MPALTPARRRAALGLGLVALALTAACASSQTKASSTTPAAGAAGASSGTLRISGSTTVNPVAADAADALRTSKLMITIDTQGGSAGGISQLGQGQIDIAMSSKPVGDADKAMYPKVAFTSTQIGRTPSASSCARRSPTVA